MALERRRRRPPADVVHVNAHATSTPLGDVAEAAGDPQRRSATPPTASCVSATKSMTGHLLGGAGAVESIATVLALHDRLAPPTINLDDPDDDVDLDVVRGEPRALPDGPIAGAQQLVRLRRPQRRPRRSGASEQ